MRKLKLQMQQSLDGFMARPNGDLDWMIWDWDEELKEYGNELTAPVDLILLGRKMSDGFLGHWSAVAANPEDPEHSFGRIMNDTPKIVFSRTLQTIEGNNTSLLKEASPEVIHELKAKPGGDIIVYGGANFVSGLFQQGLIDEFYLFINPVAIGKGLSIFNNLRQNRQLKLQHARAFSCGVAVLVYQPA